MDQRGLAEWPCTSCGVPHPAEKYKLKSRPNRQGKTPRHTQCNRCLYTLYTQPSAAKKTAEVHAYKLEHGCADCGYSVHPAALEFDHRPGEDKLFNIGEKIGIYKRETLWAEIAKCDVVCANCHAVRTAERRLGVCLS